MNKRTTLFWFACVCLLIGTLEIFSFLALSILRTYRDIDYQPITYSLNDSQVSLLKQLLDGKTKYTQYDSELGWSIAPNSVYAHTKSNQNGIRANKNYTDLPQPDVLRIATFGDSFTHGDEVTNDEMWQSLMEHMNPKIEVLNFGVGGYGVDQSFLRYQRDGIKRKPHIVVIGIVPLNLFRSVNQYRPFHSRDTGIPLTKPRFVLKNNQLVLLPNPIQDLQSYASIIKGEESVYKEIGKHDYMYQTQYHKGPMDILSLIRLGKILFHQNQLKAEYKKAILINRVYNPASEAFKVTTRILEEFSNQALLNGSYPLIVIMPSKYDIPHKEGDAVDQYHLLVKYLKFRNLDYLDLGDAFKREGSEDPHKEFFKQVHYSAQGHKIVAREIYDYLNSKKLLDIQTIENHHNAFKEVLKQIEDDK